MMNAPTDLSSCTNTDNPMGKTLRGLVSFLCPSLPRVTRLPRLASGGAVLMILFLALASCLTAETPAKPEASATEIASAVPVVITPDVEPDLLLPSEINSENEESTEFEVPVSVIEERPEELETGADPEIPLLDVPLNTDNLASSTEIVSPPGEKHPALEPVLMRGALNVDQAAADVAEKKTELVGQLHLEEHAVQRNRRFRRWVLVLASRARVPLVTTLKLLELLKKGEFFDEEVKVSGSFIDSPSNPNLRFLVVDKIQVVTSALDEEPESGSASVARILDTASGTLNVATAALFLDDYRMTTFGSASPSAGVASIPEIVDQAAFSAAAIGSGPMLPGMEDNTSVAP